MSHLHSLQLLLDESCFERVKYTSHIEWLKSRVNGKWLALDEDIAFCREVVLDYFKGPGASLFVNAEAADGDHVLDAFSEYSLSFAFLVSCHVSTLATVRALPAGMECLSALRTEEQQSDEFPFLMASGPSNFRREFWKTVQLDDLGDFYQLSVTYPWITAVNIAKVALVYFPLGEGKLATAILPMTQKGMRIGKVSTSLRALRGTSTGELILDRVMIPKDQVIPVRTYEDEEIIGQSFLVNYVFGISRSLLTWVAEVAVARKQEFYFETAIFPLAQEFCALRKEARKFALPAKTALEREKISKQRARCDDFLFRLFHACQVMGGTATLSGAFGKRFEILQREVNFCVVHYANPCAIEESLKLILQSSASPTPSHFRPS